MRIVSENSEADLARRRETEKVRWALRDLTANLLRVVRGAGKPHEIGLQAQALIETLISYREAAGCFPQANDFTNLLNVDFDIDLLLKCSEESQAHYYAKQRVIRGALQIVASRLVDQKTQQAAGSDEMFEGIREIEALRAEQRRPYAAASAAHRDGARGRVTRPKKPKA